MVRAGAGSRSPYFYEIYSNIGKLFQKGFPILYFRDVSHSLLDSCSISIIEKLTVSDRCEIRTRATEVTGALNQRLRPLGQPTMSHEQLLAGVVARVRQQLIIFQKPAKISFKVKEDP